MKKMIKKCNTPNVKLFLQLDLGFYRVIMPNVLQTKTSDDSPTMELQEFSLQDDIFTQFMDNLVVNFDYLRDDVDSNIFLIHVFWIQNMFY